MAAIDKGSGIAEHAHCCGGWVSSQAILAGLSGAAPSYLRDLLKECSVRLTLKLTTKLRG